MATDRPVLRIVVLMALAALAWLCPPAAAQTGLECAARPVLIQGNSLSPLLRSGTTVFLQPDACVAEVHRNDLIVFRTGALADPVIKIARGLPGDRFALDAEGHVLVNGEQQRNSAGLPYRLPATGRGMLGAYERNYRGMLPANAYLLLGDNPTGALDSSRLGLVHRDDFIMVGPAR